MLNLKNKIAIVTGCGSVGNGWGNGRAIATTLSRQGAKVIGTDLNINHANNTKNYIINEGNFCETFVKLRWNGTELAWLHISFTFGMSIWCGFT